MTGRERMLRTLRFEQPDRPPHFESMFELEQAAFGLQFPDRASWAGCNPGEKQRKIACCMEIYARMVEEFHWDALAVYWPWGDPDGVAAAKKTFGASILIGGMVGGGVWSIETIQDWEQFALDLMERPEVLHAEARRRCDAALRAIDRLMDAGADFIYMPNDIAGNGGTFIAPAQLDQLVFPYWAQQVQRVKDRGALAFIHSDGQLMPVFDQVMRLGAHALQSIDPMAGMDIAAVKQRTRGRLALMGNVQCSLLQDGPREAIRQSALNCLEKASPGGGYIFSTSNTIFSGMPLENYRYMLEVYRQFCRGAGVEPGRGSSNPGVSQTQPRTC